MEITSSIIAFVAISLTLIYNITRKQKSYSFKKVLPPEAGGAWRIIGHLLLLGGSEPPHITLAKLAQKYGPIFTLRMGAHNTVVLTSSEIARECFTTHDKVFANQPEAVAAVEHMAYNYAMFGFSPYGPYWRRVRRIASLELLSNQHILRRLDRVAGSEVERAVKEISKSSSSSCEVEMKEWFGEITLNTGLRIVVGERCGDDGRYLKAIRDFFKLTGTFVVGDAIPWLRWLDFGGHEKAMKSTFRELDVVLQGWLEKHKRNRDDDDD